ncbi:hypothetical protein HID58_002222 [Brassica napus]|uniref:Uncharacterized protein n=1 Tax=Brassica napus TaxID=3708 RepID=A0ABQ8ELW2_BRANA|nr:hypothetical protein HID58_002222 [Brassica napus]
MNSNRNSTVSGGFISKQSNGTDGASSAEPIKRTGQSVSSDSNKRFVYDVGAYNSDDDKADENEADGGGSLEEGGDRSKDVNGGSSHKEVGDTYSTTRKIEVPSWHAYWDAQADLNSALRPVEIVGNLAFIEKAEKLINEVIAQVGVIIGRGDYQEHADKVESTDSGCPCYL